MQDDSFSSSLEDLLSEETDHSPLVNGSSPLLMVTELRKSLTGLDRCVKTYSFLPSEDQIPTIQVDNGSVVFMSPDPEEEVSGDEGLGPDDDEFSEYDAAAGNTFPRGGMDSFASDVFSTFESNLVRSQSLPDIFSNLALDLSDDEESNASSVLDSSKDSILDDNASSLNTSLPPIKMQQENS